MMRSYANSELIWRGDRLALKGGRRGSPAVEIVPEDSYPGMWRIRMQDGSLIRHGQPCYGRAMLLARSSSAF